ncbi:acyl-CoA dehydrogenase family protein [Pseudonocardia xishanensis]|uniref:Citronellyl-CoA dehydrogenase n=1 Tax=Pseudonocardia xishanensis TaxID=630995 RepID=A0ABP8REA0_9PSEU
MSVVDAPEEQDLDLFRAACVDFAARVVAPAVEEAEATGRFPRHVLRAAGEAGLLGVSLPVELGGQGAPFRYHCVVAEEMGRVCPGIGAGLSGPCLGILAAHGSPEQHERWLRPAVAGELLGAIALTDPDGGSDLLAMRGSATRVDDGWHIRASKMYITGGPISDFMIVLVYTDRQAGARGMSAFVVDSSTPGVEIRELDKLGHRSIETGAVFLDCVVPPDAIVGREGDGMRCIGTFLERGRLLHAARSLGVARAAYDAAVLHAQQRQAFGGPLTSHQSMAFRLARMLTDVRTARLHLEDACAVVERGGGTDATVAASMAKMIAAEVSVEVSLAAMHVLGGQGYMSESPVQRYVRDALLYPISEGTTEIQLRTIAKYGGVHAAARN